MCILIHWCQLDLTHKDIRYKKKFQSHISFVYTFNLNRQKVKAEKQLDKAYSLSVNEGHMKFMLCTSKFVSSTHGF